MGFIGKQVTVHHQNYEGWEGQIIALDKDLWLSALEHTDEHHQLVILALKPQECQLLTV